MAMHASIQAFGIILYNKGMNFHTGIKVICIFVSFSLYLLTNVSLKMQVYYIPYMHSDCDNLEWEDLMGAIRYPSGVYI